MAVVYLVRALRMPSSAPAIRASIQARRCWSQLKPISIVPCSVAVPKGVLRRKMGGSTPFSSSTVRETCDWRPRTSSSSSTLVSLVRPKSFLAHRGEAYQKRRHRASISVPAQCYHLLPEFVGEAKLSQVPRKDEDSQYYQ